MVELAAAIPQKPLSRRAKRIRALLREPKVIFGGGFILHKHGQRRHVTRREPLRRM